jgi:AcrR family transcriptional regulator
MKSSTARGYRSALREEQAAGTRRRILDAAAELFADQGYAATSITAVATAAGAAGQTVYNAFGTKHALLRATVDRTLVGDDEPVPLADRPEVRELYAMTDPVAFLHGYAELGRRVLERVGRLLWQVTAGAAGGDPDLAALDRTMADQRRTGTLMVVRRVEELGALAPGLSPERARDRIWALNSTELWRLLTDPGTGAGWSGEEYARWVGDAMCAAVLDPTLSPARGPAPGAGTPPAGSP